METSGLQICEVGSRQREIRMKRTGSPYRKNDLVRVEHKKSAFSLKMTASGHYSLAMVLDTKPKISYVVYVAGKGSEVKFDPFWIDNECLIPYGDSHEFGHHHGWHESPTK